MEPAERLAIFEQQVFSFIFSDIDRELQGRRAGKQGSNFLTALGLMCYTEFVGALGRNVFAQGEAEKNFNAFLSRMGPSYSKLMDRLSVYDIFRCGLAYQYRAKSNCVIAMFGSVRCGIGKSKSGKYFVVVSKYFDDFKAACCQLYKEL